VFLCDPVLFGYLVEGVEHRSPMHWAEQIYDKLLAEEADFDRERSEATIVFTKLFHERYAEKRRTGNLPDKTQEEIEAIKVCKCSVSVLMCTSRSAALDPYVILWRCRRWKFVSISASTSTCSVSWFSST
jgi:hypothetical protein